MDNRLIAENSAGISAQVHLEYLKPLFEQMSADIIRRWQESKPAEAAKRETLWREIAALNALEGRIKQIIQTGSMAKAAIERQRKRH